MTFTQAIDSLALVAVLLAARTLYMAIRRTY